MRRTSSAPKGAPCASALLRLVGAGSAMTVRSAINVGLDDSACAVSYAWLMAARSFPSATLSTSSHRPRTAAAHPREK